MPMVKARARKRSPYLGMMASAAAATAGIEAWARRRGDPLEGNVPTFGLLLALPAMVAFRAAASSRRHPEGTGTRPRGWAAWSAAATVASMASAVGARTAVHVIAPPKLDSQPYHYRHFHYGFYDVERPEGIGSALLDAKVTDLDGKTVNLPDLVDGRPLVIEFGSISCPIYTEKVNRTNGVADRYADRAHFVMLYTREAHPGPKYDAIDSLDDKRTRARDLEPVVGERRRIVLDDVDGKVHRHYGSFPNSLLVVGSDGVVACWAEWTTDRLMERELGRVLDNGGLGAGLRQTMVSYNFARPGTLGGDLRAFLRPGLRSLADFALALPRMALGRASAKVFKRASGLRIV